MMKIPRFVVTPSICAFFATIILGVSHVQAANGTWLNTGSADGNWSTSSNWGSGTVPGATSGTTNADTATFNTTLGTYGTSGNPIVIDSGRNLKSILFDTSAGSYFIGSTGGNALLLTSGGNITMNAAVANAETINAPLVIEGVGGSYTITNNATSSAALLVIGAGISGGAGNSTSQTTLNLNGSNTGANTLSGNISNGSANYFSVAKGGTGTWVLAGTNALSNAQNYNTALTVNAGTLDIQGATTVVAKGTVAVAAGSTLEVSGAGAFAVTGGTTNTPVSISGTLLLDDSGSTQMTNRFSGGFTLSNGGDFSYVGNALAGSSETNSSNITISSGVSTITVASGGANTATVTEGALTRTASTGGLVLINGTNLGASSSGVGQFLTTTGPKLVGTTTASSSGISQLVTNSKVALFVLGESGTGTGQNGTVTGTANTFLTYNAVTGYRPLNPTDEFTNDVIVAGDNIYLTTGTTTTSGTTAINSLVVNGGNLAITSGTLTNTSGMLLFAQNGTISGAGTFTLGGASNQEGIVALDAGVNATISSVLSTGTTGLTVSGSGTLTLSGANTYTGTTAVGIGSTLVIGNASALGSSTITAAGGTIQGDGQAHTITNTLVDTTSGIMIGGSSDLTFTGGGTVGTPAFANSNFANSQVKVNNTGTTTFSGVFSLLNAASGSNNGSGILALGSSANVVISGPIQDNNTGNVGSASTGFGSIPFTGVGANFSILGNNGYGVGKTTTILADGGYNTVTIGGPGGAGATITPFGATTLNINTNNVFFLVAATDGQILGNNINSGGSGFSVGFAGTNSLTLGGTWAAAATSTLINLSTATLTFGNTISGNAFNLVGTGNTTLNSNATMATGAFAFTANQTGTVTLSNVNNFTGNTTLSGGTVVLDYSTNNNTKLTQLGTAGSAAALSLGGVNLQLSGGSYAQTLGTPSSGTNGTTLTQGQSTITQTSGTSTIALGAITRSTGAAIDFQTGVANTTTANASGILGGYATVGGTDWATGGGSIAALSSYDSFTTPGTNANILQTDSGSVAANTTVNSLKIATTQTGQSLAIASGQALGLTSGGLLFTGGNNYSITGGTLKPTASSGDFIVQQYGTGVLTIGSVIAGNGGTATLTKAGTGTLALTGANTYTGATYLTAGILQIGADNNLGTVGAINFNGGTLETTAGFSTSRAMSLATNGGTFQVDTGTLTSTGIISGTSYAGLTKTGAGTLLLKGANTFLGPVTVSAGTLQLGNASALGASSTSSNRSVAPVTVNGGTLDINGQTTALGNVMLKSGAISDTAGGGTLAAYSFTLQSGMVGAALADLSFSGNPNSNSINLYKTTGGTVTLSGANTYTGSTLVNAGTLFVNGSISNASLVTVNSGGRVGGTGSVGAVMFNTGAGLAYNVANVTQSTGLTATSFSGTGLGSFTIYLTGAAAGFDSTQSYSWTVLTSTQLASVTLSGITVDASSFGQAYTGSFNVSEAGNSLLVNYIGSAIPEPATYALMAGVGLFGFALWRKRRAV